jgi:hypothetical protein
MFEYIVNILYGYFVQWQGWVAPIFCTTNSLFGQKKCGQLNKIRLSREEFRAGFSIFSKIYWGSFGRIGIGEGLYCKRPIQCLASSEILTPHPLTTRRVCTPPPLVRGEDTLARGRGGGGSTVRKTPDTALYSIYVSTL